MNATEELQHLVYQKLISTKEPIPYSDEGIKLFSDALADFVDNNELIEVVVLIDLSWYKRLINFFYPFYPTEAVGWQWRRKDV